MTTYRPARRRTSPRSVQDPPFSRWQGLGRLPRDVQVPDSEHRSAPRSHLRP